MAVSSRQLLLAFLGLLWAISAAAGADPKAPYRLVLRAQEFTTALVNNQTWEMYRMFVPAFRAEIRFHQFDSAFRAWVGQRRIAKASFRVIDVRGLGGHASTFVRFEGETDYNYVYQSWLRTGDNWELVWLSNILDQRFEYGRSDSVALEAVAQTALRYLLSTEGLNRLRKGLVLPETIVVVRHDRKEEGAFTLNGRTVVWLTPEQIALGRDVPLGEFHCEFGLVRVFGDLALAAVDLVPTKGSRTQGLDRRRGMQLYIRRDPEQGGTWQVHSVGKVY